MKGEKDFLLKFVRPEFEKKTLEEVTAEMRKLHDSEEEIKAVLKAAGNDVKGLLRLIDEAAASYDELGKILDLPYNRVGPAVAAFREKYAESNPNLASFAKTAENVRYSVARVEAKWAMLRAALAITREGKDRLKDSKDPFADGPFAYRSFPGGFELKSALKYKELPSVTLVVGSERKE
jgi:hypothetical protein